MYVCNPEVLKRHAPKSANPVCQPSARAQITSSFLLVFFKKLTQKTLRWTILAAMNKCVSGCFELKNVLGGPEGLARNRNLEKAKGILKFMLIRSPPFFFVEPARLEKVKGFLINLAGALPGGRKQIITRCWGYLLSFAIHIVFQIKHSIDSAIRV